LFDKVSQLWRRLLFYARRDRFDRELEEEMRFHLEMKAQENAEAEMELLEARYAARRQFGNQTLLLEVSRDMWSFRFLETLAQDMRYGLRMMIKNPGFTAVASLTLALGIGANTAVFSVINATLLRPLPFLESERLALVWDDRPLGNSPHLPLSLPDFIDVREQCQSCAEMSAWSWHGSFNLSGGVEPEKVQYAVVSANLFSVLGAQPMLGRNFRPEEDKPSSSRAIIISHNLWQRRFGANPNFIGKTVTLDGQAFEVCGILPASFRFVNFPKETEIWLPFGLDPLAKERIYNRNGKGLGVITRLKPGIDLARAQTEMTEISRRLEQQYPHSDHGIKLRVVALGEQAVKNLRLALHVLLGAAAFVLLIACANVANLQLARAAARGSEMAIRAALGAGRWRLVRQLLIENAMLALIGGATGVSLAFWLASLLKRLPFNQPTFFMPYAASPQQISIDSRVLAGAFLLSLLTSVICGVFPALQASKPDVQASIKEGAGRLSSGRTTQRARSFLIVAEVALALLLLAGAGLMVKSFMRLQRVDPGFNPENVLTFETRLAASKYAKSYQIADFYTRLLERIAALPGVAAAGAVEFLPFSGVDNTMGVFIEGRPAPPPGERSPTHFRSTTTDYFQALGLQLRQGRGFTERDNLDAPLVTIINETMARQYWPGENPIGKRVAIEFDAMRFRPDGSLLWDPSYGMREIVGVVADVKHSRLDAESVPEMYIPVRQLRMRQAREMTIAVRATSDPLALAGAVRRELAAIDPDQPISNLTTMSQLLAASVSRTRFNFLAFSLFAVIALALAAVGIYGVIAYSVSHRTHEIGVRLALGAQAADVLRLIIREGMGLVLAGVGIGLAGALALTRLMKTLLFDVSATDPLTFTVIALLLTFVALLACWIPARRATKVDPIIALRFE
jgi:putative ABC transport system permease protein